MATVQGGTLVVTLEGKDVNLSDLLNKIENQMQKGATTAKNFDNTIAGLSATTKRNESSLASYAQAQARFAESSGNSNLAVQRLVQAMQQLTPNTAAANNVLTQLQGTLNRQAAAANAAAQAQAKANAEAQKAAAATAAQQQQSLSAVTNFAGGFQKLIGAYFAATTAAQTFAAAINAGNQLEKAQATFRALSGDAANYEKNLAAARAQQERFGGSLQENIEGLSGFANLARRTGIDINELANTARALAVVDPAQGFKGASIALKEFFSGDITSLARRFEIPRDRLNELKELAQDDAPAAFQRLQAVLEEFGISQSLLAEQANTTAVAYDKLGGAAQDAFAAVGQLLAEGLLPIAQQLTTSLQGVAQGLTALRESGDQKLAIEQSLITTAASAEEFNQKIAGVNQQLQDGVASAQLGVLALTPLAPLLKAIVTEGLRFEELTQAELTFAQGAIEAGQSLESIRGTISQVKVELDNLENAFAIAPENINATREQLSGYEQAVFAAAQASAEGATFANAISVAIFNQEMTVQEGTQKLLDYVAGLEQLRNASTEVTDAHDRHTFAVEAESTALGEQAIKTQESAIQADQLKRLQESLASIGGAVRAGHLTAADGAAILAAQYNLTSQEAARLLELQAKLAGANAAAQGFGKGKGVSNRGLAGELGRTGAQTQKDRDKLKRDAQDLLAAESQLAKAKGDTAGAIAKLREAQRGLNKDSKEYVDLETKIVNLQNQGAKAKGGGAGGGGAKGKSPKLTEQEKLHNQLLSQADKFNNQMEDLESKHQQKLLDIIKEFNEEQLRVQQENEILKRRSRFDFYSNLNKSQLSPIDRQAFAAAYEEAFKKAQEIAQSGRAKLAQEFLELKQQHIEELKSLAEEEQEIRSDKDLSRGEKDARLRELEERRKLLQDAQREEEKQLLEGGDAVENKLRQRIEDENAAYADQAEKIITAAERAGDSKIVQAERARKAVSEENRVLADQLLLYQKINTANGGKPPALAAPTTPVTGAPATAQPTPILAPEAIPVKTDTPLPVATPEALIVKQFELFVVRDQGVIDALGDQTARLEGKLDSILAQLVSENNNLSGKLDQIRSAISNSQRTAIRP